MNQKEENKKMSGTEIDLKNRMEARKKKKEQEEEEKSKEPVPVPVTAGPVDKVVDMVFNPSDEKMLEFTVLDHNQVRLIPQLGIIDEMWEYCIDIAEYRNISDLFAEYHDSPRPSKGNLMKRFIFLTAQCQKSLQGQNMKSAIDVALADIDARANRELEDEFNRIPGEYD